jgi:SAM-dependent methyltransferase
VTTEPDLSVNRALVAQWFLRGDGIEIGALHNPLKMPAATSVKYVDRMSAGDLRLQYPELEKLPLVDPDIIDDGETLSQVAASTQDFVVANHFLEHCQNPIATLQNFIRVLKPEGILYLVIPDKLYTFDKHRPSTTLEHIIRDFGEGPAWSREFHYREYARLVDHASPGEAEELRAQQLMGMNYSIHFHVWTKGQALELLHTLNEKYRLGYEVRFFLDNGPEGIYLLQKSVECGKPATIILPPEAAAIPNRGTTEAGGGSGAAGEAASPFWSRIRERWRFR